MIPIRVKRKRFKFLFSPITNRLLIKGVRKGVSFKVDSFSINKSRIFVLKPVAKVLFERIRRVIHGILHGYFVEIRTEGVGFRFIRYQRAPSLIGLTLNFGHMIFYKFPKSVRFRCLKYRLLLYSNRPEVLYETASRIRNYRRPDPFKGKGLKYAKERLKFKPGKERNR